MVLQERLAETVEIRPGRSIFCRHWRLSNGAKAVASRHVHLVCVHGTAANHQQYLPLLRALETRLVEQGAPSVILDCWMYDAIGCGDSPALDDADSYVDSEQVQDLESLLRTKILSTQPAKIVFLGHSYGPNWIYKVLLETEDDGLLQVEGMILVSSSLHNPKHQLQKGGPALFRFPLWLLRCLQPMLTQAFLGIGFAKATREHNPSMIEEAKKANNANDMKVVRHYYRAHDWVEDLQHVKRAYKGESTKSPLIVHGVEDQVIPISCGQDLANQWGVPLESMEDASHMVLMEQPHKLASKIARYLLEVE